MNTTTNIKNNPIGFFDSGVGGLTVYSKFRNQCPNENCLYFGDTKHLPYGNKSKSDLISYAKFILDFYKDKNVKAVVIACNTSSSAAYNYIKDDYDFKIYPIIQCCAKILAEMSINKLGILATPATIKSGVYDSEIKKYNANINIYTHACNDWVNIVENKLQNKDGSIDIIKKDINTLLKYNPDKIVLGCTHYPYLLNSLSTFVDKNLFIDPAEFFVNYIKDDLIKNDLLNNNSVNGKETIFVSAAPEKFMTSAEMFYNVKVLPTLINN